GSVEMVSRALVVALVLSGCGVDLVLQSHEQRDLRYQIQLVERELELAELRLDQGRRCVERAIVDTCFGRDPELRTLGSATAEDPAAEWRRPSVLALAEGARP
ncbi:MAG: hypothetical protein KDC38_10745, partial [Planctomycetes bacterium]|nr:hypothetical protein [Planctomycetota bacterium]